MSDRLQISKQMFLTFFALKPCCKLLLFALFVKKANNISAFHFWLMLNVDILNGGLIGFPFFFLSLSLHMN